MIGNSCLSSNLLLFFLYPTLFFLTKRPHFLFAVVDMACNFLNNMYSTYASFSFLCLKQLTAKNENKKKH